MPRQQLPLQQRFDRNVVRQQLGCWDRAASSSPSASSSTRPPKDGGLDLLVYERLAMKHVAITLIDS